jgi:hypothetical protein
VRRRRTADPQVPQPIGQPHVIQPTGVYFLNDVIAVTRAKRTAIREAIEAEQLRVSFLAGRYVFLGEDLLNWIRSAPRPRRKAAADRQHNHTATDGQ